MLARWLGSGYTELIIPGRREPGRESLLQLAFCELSYSQESERKHCTLFQGMMGGGGRKGGDLEILNRNIKTKII